MAAGFGAITRSPRRLIANIQSIKKSCGKTRLALTGKKPLGYISIEIGGEEGVADGFIKSGADSNEDIQIVRIRMGDPVYPDPSQYGTDKDSVRKYDDAVSAAVQAVAVPAMDTFYAAYYASIANMQTTVVDTSTDLYALMRMADFGRLEKIPQLAYTQVKRAFAKLMDDAFSNKGSVLYLSHMKDKGAMVEDPKTGKKNWQATGQYETDCCNVLIDKVQANIELWREDLTTENEMTGRRCRFNGQIIDSRHSADSIGKVFTDDDITIADIGLAIMNGSQRGDWV